MRIFKIFNLKKSAGQPAEEQKLFTALENDTPLAELSEPALYPFDFLYCVNALLMFPNGFKPFTLDDVRTVDIFSGNFFLKSGFMLRKENTCIYIGIQERKIFVSAADKLEFSPAEQFRIYLEKGQIRSVFANCSYYKGQVCVSGLFWEEQDDEGLFISLPKECNKKFPQPLTAFIDVKMPEQPNCR